MSDDAWQALWQRERKRSARRRWFIIFGFASVFIAYVSAPYVATYFLIDASAPIINELLEHKIVSPKFSRRYAFNESSRAKLLVNELQRLNIEYQLTQVDLGLHVVKINSYHIEQVEKILESKKLHPIITDVSLKLEDNSTSLKIETSGKY